MLTENNLMIYHKVLEEEKYYKFKSSANMKNLKIRTEINKTKTKSTKSMN